MKRKLLLGLIWSLALPVITRAVPPYELGLAGGQYALVPPCRFAGTAPSWIEGNTSTWDWIKFINETNYLLLPCVLGQCPELPVLFSPGEGGILSVSPGDGDVFLFQQYNPPKLPLTLKPGFNLVCSQIDTNATFEDIAGTPPDSGVMLYQFNVGSGRNPFNLAPPDYTIYTFSNGAWSPTNPVVGITEAVFVLQPPKLFNVRATTKGIAFEISVGKPTTIEYSDSLTQPSWQVLTNIVGNAISVKITDESGATTNRFYRARITP